MNKPLGQPTRIWLKGEMEPRCGRLSGFSHEAVYLRDDEGRIAPVPLGNIVMLEAWDDYGGDGHENRAWSGEYAQD